MSKLLTAEGEEALRRLNSLRAFFSKSAAVFTSAPSKRLGDRSPSSDSRTLQESVILRCVTVVEAYMTDLARRLVDDHLNRLPTGDADLAALAEHLRDSRLTGLDHGKWDELIGLWRDGLGVPISQQYSGYSKLKNLRTTRHAIAHRYGEITAQYRRQHKQRLLNEGFRDPLAATGPVPLSDTDVDDALTLGVETVKWLEGQL